MTNLTAQTQHPGDTGDMASPADKGRRKFLVAAGWSLMGASMAGTAFAAYKYLFPPVLYEPPTVFKIGHVSIYGLGVDERWKLKGRFWVVRNMRGSYNTISICRHLGCTPNWFPDQKRFRCPCHGSIYDAHGNVRGGPAPRTLWRGQITRDPLDGELIVNTVIRLDPDPVQTPQGLWVKEKVKEVTPFYIDHSAPAGASCASNRLLC